MNISNKIDRFLYNNLTESEKSEFEKELLENPELSNSYKTYSKANSLFENSLKSPVFEDAEDPLLKDLTTEQKLDIENDFIKYHIFPNNENDPADSNANNAKSEDELKFLSLLDQSADEVKKENSSKILKVIFGIAATLALTIVAGKYILEIPILQTAKISPQKAFLTYYNPSNDSELNAFSINNHKEKNISSQLNRSLGNEYSYYTNKGVISQEEYDFSLLYRGILNIERKNIPEAKKCFSYLLESKTFEKRYVCLFYYSMALLSEGNSRDAKPYLTELSEGNTSYSKQSKKLLKRLIIN